jgi:hypothetical protein
MKFAYLKPLQGLVVKRGPRGDPCYAPDLISFANESNATNCLPERSSKCFSKGFSFKLGRC